MIAIILVSLLVHCLHVWCLPSSQSMRTLSRLEILRNYESMLEVILPSLPTTAAGMSAPEGRAAFVWILGEYGDVSLVGRVWGVRVIVRCDGGMGERRDVEVFKEEAKKGISVHRRTGGQWSCCTWSL